MGEKMPDRMQINTPSQNPEPPTRRVPAESSRSRRWPAIEHSAVPRDPSGNPARSAEGSRDVIRVVVYALYRLRPNGLGASEDSGPDDEKGAQKASFGASCGLGAGDCRWLRLPLTVS